MGEDEAQTPKLPGDGNARTPLTTPGHMGNSPELSQGREPEDLLFVTPPERDRPSGTAGDEPTEAEGDMNRAFLE